MTILTRLRCRWPAAPTAVVAILSAGCATSRSTFGRPVAAALADTHTATVTSTGATPPTPAGRPSPPTVRTFVAGDGQASPPTGDVAPSGTTADPRPDAGGDGRTPVGAATNGPATASVSAVARAAGRDRAELFAIAAAAAFVFLGVAVLQRQQDGRLRNRPRQSGSTTGQRAD